MSVEGAAVKLTGLYFDVGFVRNATTQNNNDNTQISSAVTHAPGNEGHITDHEEIMVTGQLADETSQFSKIPRSFKKS